jgi:glutamine amidotransferase
MCRLLGYLGSPIKLNYLLEKPKHSLIVQSYQPREMTSGLLNADGFGIGWYHPVEADLPYTYKNVLPIWSDINLPQLSRYIESPCIVGYVRSATPGLSVDLLNCQPFQRDRLLFIHNGYIDNFRNTLFKPIRDSLNHDAYLAINGTTDSEHIFALIVSELQTQPGLNLSQALVNALNKLTILAQAYNTSFSANIVLSSNGDELLACRYSNRQTSPSLYYIKNDPTYPDSVIIASEPMFEGHWNSCSDKSIISVRKNLDISINSIP